MQVTFEEYPEVSYPTNCHGTFYLFSGQVRNKLLEVKYFISYENPHHTPCTAGFCGTGGENFQDRRRLCHRDSGKRGGRNNTQVEMSQLIFIQKLIRPVNGMVGISVGLNNAYSMLTGPFRLNYKNLKHFGYFFVRSRITLCYKY